MASIWPADGTGLRSLRCEKRKKAINKRTPTDTLSYFTTQCESDSHDYDVTRFSSSSILFMSEYDTKIERKVNKQAYIMLIHICGGV